MFITHKIILDKHFPLEITDHIDEYVEKHQQTQDLNSALEYATRIVRINMEIHMCRAMKRLNYDPYPLTFAQMCYYDMEFREFIDKYIPMNYLHLTAYSMCEAWSTERYLTINDKELIKQFWIIYENLERKIYPGTVREI